MVNAATDLTGTIYQAAHQFWASWLQRAAATRSGPDDPDGFRHVFRKPEEIGVTSMKLRKNIVSTSKYISTIPRNLSFFHIRLFE
jgi:hypothetical protein